MFYKYCQICFKKYQMNLGQKKVFTSDLIALITTSPKSSIGHVQGEVYVDKIKYGNIIGLSSMKLPG